LALRLLDDLALRPSAVTKAQRGYRLFRRAGLRPQRSKRVHLDATMTPLAAAHALIGASLEQYQANEEGVLRSTAPEFVHQARIALRRMRSTLQLFRDVIGAERATAWRARLNGAAAALGVARDWDVLATETLPPLVAAHGDRAVERTLEAAVARRRRRERETARAALRSADHARVILELARWLSTPAAAAAGTEPLEQFASRVIRKRHKRLSSGAGKLASMTPAQRHRVRIDAKRLRYGVEGLASLFKARRVKRYLRGLTALQDALGRLNDAAAARRLLAGLDLPQAFAAFARGWCAARLHGDPVLLQSIAERLQGSKRFWRKRPAQPAAAA
jgi:CHAD domain-containing protein